MVILKILALEPLYALKNYGEPSPTTTKGFCYYELHFQIVTPLELKARKCLKLLIHLLDECSARLSIIMEGAKYYEKCQFSKRRYLFAFPQAVDENSTFSSALGSCFCFASICSHFHRSQWSFIVFSFHLIITWNIFSCSCLLLW